MPSLVKSHLRENLNVTLDLLATINSKKFSIIVNDKKNPCKTIEITKRKKRFLNFKMSTYYRKQKEIKQKRLDNLDTKIAEIIENTNITEIIENTNITEIMKNTNIAESIENTNIAEIIENTNITEIAENNNILEIVKIQISQKSQEIRIS
ncbi:hypothetical protein PV325_009228 [Microctonus aethiopoides]|uniref:Uncharacterized protein n=1 Tax=Microctonus aethiopoides TaxID=144406 RepID=A0AA39KL74_9HYME|nr:hypothetical protein PV325_009228 [Microctonus aethiopoides]KAK0075012.1 hypothetical protein PV326_011958 [Microctonus aethiopoides]KAK0165534.1 hypothetical protein PV328_004041 [Microctonus aethiopoides]